MMNDDDGWPEQTQRRWPDGDKRQRKKDRKKEREKEEEALSLSVPGVSVYSSTGLFTFSCSALFCYGPRGFPGVSGPQRPLGVPESSRRYGNVTPRLGGGC